eukprot:PLAT6716.1.p1 GENE.PLAT6716.1~~PLAT6716.1.p1  ORF type:complete len:527 (+),score=196.39 PLAT6716.1:37-1581(+)
MAAVSLDVREETLDEWVRLSCTEDGRATLGEAIEHVAAVLRAFLDGVEAIATREAADGKPARVDVSALPIDKLTQLMRLLRNSCAGCARNQDLVRSSGALADVVRTLCVAARCPPFASWRLCVSVAVQTLGNSVNGNSASAKALWEMGPAELFRALLWAFPADEKLIAYMHMVLFALTSPRGDEMAVERLKDLALEGEVCMTVLGALVTPTEGAADWALLLFDHMLHAACLPLLYANAARDATRFSPEQATLLSALLEKVERGDCGLDGVDFTWLLPLLSRDTPGKGGEESKVVDLSDDAADELDDAQAAQLAARRCSTLEILSLLTSTADYDRAPLLAAGAIDAVLPLLRESDVELLWKPPTMRFLANLLFHCPLAQKQLREAGGIETVMNHCAMDEHNPVMREWSIMAIRNATEGNPRNQEYIAALQPDRAVATDALDKMGLEVELVGGKPRVKAAKSAPVEEFKAAAEEAAAAASTVEVLDEEGGAEEGKEQEHKEDVLEDEPVHGEAGGE